MTSKYRVILRTLSIVALVAGSVVLAPRAGDAKETSKTSELSIVVMDPLSAPLSCPCVEGYAQRKYEALAKFLEKKTGRKVRLTFAGALNTALKGDAKGKADLIIGKDSVIRADAKKLGIGVTALGCLTDKEGKTTQTGLIVVPSSDPAKKLADLNDYRILFGPADCQEKHQAAINSLKSVGVAIPKKLEVDQACSDGACRILEFGTKVRAAAVISSYAAPLLEGCGTIKKGDLRVVGETKPVPFITAFATDSLTAKEQKVIQESLMQVISHPKLCTAIETLLGFIPPEEAGVVVKKK